MRWIILKYNCIPFTQLSDPDVALKSLFLYVLLSVLLRLFYSFNASADITVFTILLLLCVFRNTTAMSVDSSSSRLSPINLELSECFSLLICKLSCTKHFILVILKNARKSRTYGELDQVFLYFQVNLERNTHRIQSRLKRAEEV